MRIYIYMGNLWGHKIHEGVTSWLEMHGWRSTHMGEQTKWLLRPETTGARTLLHAFFFKGSEVFFYHVSFRPWRIPLLAQCAIVKAVCGQTSLSGGYEFIELKNSMTTLLDVQAILRMQVKRPFPAESSVVPWHAAISAFRRDQGVIRTSTTLKSSETENRSIKGLKGDTDRRPNKKKTPEDIIQDQLTCFGGRRPETRVTRAKDEKCGGQQRKCQFYLLVVQITPMHGFGLASLSVAKTLNFLRTFLRPRISGIFLVSEDLAFSLSDKIFLGSDFLVILTGIDSCNDWSHILYIILVSFPRKMKQKQTSEFSYPSKKVQSYWCAKVFVIKISHQDFFLFPWAAFYQICFVLPQVGQKESLWRVPCAPVGFNRYSHQRNSFLKHKSWLSVKKPEIEGCLGLFVSKEMSDKFQTKNKERTKRIKRMCSDTKKLPFNFPHLHS